MIRSENISSSLHWIFCSVGGSIILLKPQQMHINVPLAKFFTQKFLQHHHIWCYHGWLTISILEKVGPENAERTNSTPNCNFLAMQRSLMQQFELKLHEFHRTHCGKWCTVLDGTLSFACNLVELI
jgi:hypothetical protein